MRQRMKGLLPGHASWVVLTVLVLGLGSVWLYAADQPAAGTLGEATKAAEAKGDGKTVDAKAADPKAVEKLVIPAAAKKTAPENPKDLLAIEEDVRKLVERVMPTIVNVRVGGAQGSGVIISKDGYVLTAGHVVSGPNKDVTFTMPDGKRLRGKTLGVDHQIDSGLMKISDAGDYPFVAMGKSASLKAGDWVVALGHPGGYKAGRPPVVRIGRVIQNRSTVIWTDTTLVGGDSGGPLFDLAGDVIGIHSRISNAVTTNYHVPVDTYRDTWDRLARGEEWGGTTGPGLGGRPQPPANAGFMGITSTTHEKGVRIASVTPSQPAERAGLQVNDVIVKLNGQDVRTPDALQTMLNQRRAGDEVTLQILRGEESLEKKVTLARRPAA